MGRLLGVLGGRDRQHASPRGIRLGHPEPEIGQGRLDEDRAPELGRAQHDERPDRVGQDVTERDSQVLEAQRARGLDVLHLADREHARADHAGRARDDRDRNRDDHVVNGGAEGGRHHQGQHEQGQSLKNVQDPLGDQVGRSAGVAGEEPDDPPEHRAQQGRRHADNQRDARAVHDPRVDVAAEMIGAEPVLRAQPGERGGGVGRDGIVRLENVREDGRQQHHEDQHAAGGAERLLLREARENDPPSGARAGAGRDADLDSSNRHSGRGDRGRRTACPRAGWTGSRRSR